MTRRTAARLTQALCAGGHITLWTELVRARQPFTIPVEGVAAAGVSPSLHVPRDGGPRHQGG